MTEIPQQPSAILPFITWDDLNHPSGKERARSLHERFSFPLFPESQLRSAPASASSASAGGALGLAIQSEDALNIIDLMKQDSAGTLTSELPDIARKRMKQRKFAQDLLVRAVGQNARHVVDATAGFGIDTLTLLLAGKTVTAIERDPGLFAFLESGFATLSAEPAIQPAITSRLTLMYGESLEMFAQIQPPPEVVLLDPMYPTRRKSSAQPRKRLEFARRWHQQFPRKDNLPELLLTALNIATQRVVIKRPPEAPAIQVEHASATIKPNHAIEGKLIRFDVYLPEANSN